MNTGGTGDIIIGKVTGLLSRSAEELADDVVRLRGDSVLQCQPGRGGKGACQASSTPLSSLVRMELYTDLAGRR